MLLISKDKPSRAAVSVGWKPKADLIKYLCLEVGGSKKKPEKHTDLQCIIKKKWKEGKFFKNYSLQLALLLQHFVDDR